jgi:hypothetical protein
LSLGNVHTGIGTKSVTGLNDVTEVRGKREGRVYYRRKNGKIEVLAKSTKDNQKKVIAILKNMGY